MMRQGEDDGAILPLEKYVDAEDERAVLYGVLALERDVRRNGVEQLFRQWRHDRDPHEGSTPNARLAPHVGRLEILLSRADTPDLIDPLLRLLGHSGDPNVLAIIRPFLSHPDKRVREAAAIGLGLLGDSAGQELLPEILAEPLPPQQPDGPRTDEWNRILDRWTDAGLALAAIGSDSAISVLGDAFLRSVDGIVITPAPQGGSYIGGSYSAAQNFAILLGHTRNPAALLALTKSLTSGENGQQVERFVLDAIHRMPEGQSKTESIRDAVRVGNGGILRDTPPVPELRPDVEAMIQNPDTTDSGFLNGVEYLERLGGLKALDTLRAVHKSKLHADDARCRLSLARALAYLGDSRGLPESFDILKKTLDSTTLPEEDRERRREEDERGRLRDWALTVFRVDGLPPQSLVEFLSPRLTSDDNLTRAAALTIVEGLKSVPDPLQPLVETARKNR